MQPLTRQKIPPNIYARSVPILASILQRYQLARRLVRVILRQTPDSAQLPMLSMAEWAQLVCDQRCFSSYFRLGETFLLSDVIQTIALLARILDSREFLNPGSVRPTILWFPAPILELSSARMRTFLQLRGLDEKNTILVFNSSDSLLTEGLAHKLREYFPHQILLADSSSVLCSFESLLAHWLESYVIREVLIFGGLSTAPTFIALAQKHWHLYHKVSYISAATGLPQGQDLAIGVRASRIDINPAVAPGDNATTTTAENVTYLEGDLGLIIGSSNHELMTQLVISELTGLPQHAILLDVGAGERKYRAYCGHLQYTSQDFGQYDGQGNGVGFHTSKWDNAGTDIISDITAIPVGSASFDAVLCTEVLEHVPDPIAALIEIGRILRPGGKLILTAPFNSLTHFAPYYYYSGFSKYFYEYHLPRNGFRIQTLQANGGFLDVIAQELKRLEYVAREYCGGALTSFDRAGVELTLELMQQLKSRDKGSEKLLCFGYLVTAIKQ